MISETKLVKTFSSAPFSLQAFSMPDFLNRNYGVIICYIKKNIPSGVIERIF